ncbi:MAG TPA: ribonuclease E/G, partial [Sphingomicrobium sp.]|nr:ribonuclease E/G [Sphingomicrobium sp.]
HPDYYQIPKADREALLREEAEHAAEEERLRAAAFENAEDESEGDFVEEPGEEVGDDEAEQSTEEAGTASNRSPVDESAADELRQKRQNLRRRYKIQDVIQRRQVLLVQVVKEERGNKGAALTTYLSLAGRYCVLMPNTTHGGGISRKISNGADRKRLKSIMSDLNLPKTMGLIVRTAGLQRTKTEIKRDFDYLARLWDEIRERTLGSTAPALIYRDSDLIKRAIRDLYHREIEEVIVEGDEGYKQARGFMKLLMPSHVKRVKLHTETTPLFQRYGVEDQLSAMYQPIVQLKSGGYLVINPTEALVSIDINSGRSTREHNIEQTAYNTNLEAAQEIARQLRLRDMAGLIVIDFIDMEQNSHVRKVEKAMKEALKNDRARIQVGRISSFGLMEMSRQRLRTGVLEASTKPCPHCDGTGLMRTAASAGLSALRIIEDEATRGRGEKICLRAGREAAVYVLNKKRPELADIEHRYGVSIEILIDETFEGARMTVESSGPRPVAAARIEAPIEEDEDEEIDAAIEDEEEEAEAEAVGDEREHAEGDRPGRRRRRRRRGGRGRRREGGAEGEASSQTEQEAEQPSVAEEEAEAAPVSAESGKRRRRRRGRKGPESAAEGADAAIVEPESSPMVERPTDEDPPIAETAPAEEPKPKRRRSKKAAEAEIAVVEPAPPQAPPAETAEESAEPTKPARKRRTKAKQVEEAEPVAEAAAVPAANNDTAAEGDSEPRRGWWQKTFG